MARFIPAAQVQQQALPAGAGMDAGDYLGLAKSGVGLAGQAGRFLSVPGTEYAGPVGSALGLGAGIANQDPGQIGMSGANTSLETLKLLDKLGLLSGAGAGGTALGAEALAGGLGAGGLLGAEAGVGAGALGAEALGAGVGAGGLLGAEAAVPAVTLGAEALGTGVGAGGLAAAAPAAATGLSASLGLAAIPLFFIANGFANMEKKKAERIKQQTLESADIRRGAGNALTQLQGTSGLARNQRFIPAEQLGGAMEAYRGSLNAGPAGERLLSTAGVGGKASKMDALTPEQLANYEAQYRPALRDTQVGYTRAADTSAMRGELPDWALTSFGTTDPAALLQSLGTGGFNPYWDVNYSNVVPGNYGQQLPAIMQHFDPNYAQSNTANLFQQIPALALPGQTPLTPEQIAAFGQTRQDAATNTLGTYVAAAGDRSGADWLGGAPSGSAVGSAAPYLGGGSMEAAQMFGLSAPTIQDLQSGQTDWQMALGQKSAAQQELANTLRDPAWQLSQDTLNRLAQNASGGG